MSDAPPPKPEPSPEPSVPWLDRFQRRHKVLGFPIAVAYKYFDDSGPYLAALIAYYGFLALFPLLLILSTVLGIVLRNDAHLQHQILDSALRQFPVIGDQLGKPRELGGGTIGLVVGGVGTLYGGLGVAQALQYAMNAIWGVPRNSRPNPFAARGKSLLLLFIAGLAVVSITAVSIVAGDAFDGRNARIAIDVGTTAVSAGVLIVVFRMASARALRALDVLPGAVIAAIAWQFLQSFGVLYVNHVVKNATTSNGVFALVLGLVAFIYVAAVFVVLCAELNAVRVDRLYPRALLTPFTDRVVLTEGDRRAYSRLAAAQRLKGFQRIDVRFEPKPDEAGTTTLRVVADNGSDESPKAVDERA